MFDNIGRDLDEEANRRRAKSLATISCVAVLGLVVGALTYEIGDQKTEPPVDEPMVMLDPMVEALPPLPEAPPLPPPAAGQDTPDEDTPDEVVPDEMIDEVQRLEDEVEQAVADADVPQGTSDGHDNGHPDGVVGGTPGGDPNGVLCGLPGKPVCGTPPRIFHHTQLAVRKRVNPVYPEAARALAVGEQRCLVTVFLDEDGVPYDTSVDKCPKPYHEASREALMKWRWYPPKDGKTRIRAQTTIAIVYRLD